MGDVVGSQPCDLGDVRLWSRYLSVYWTANYEKISYRIFSN